VVVQAPVSQPGTWVLFSRWYNTDHLRYSKPSDHVTIMSDDVT